MRDHHGEFCCVSFPFPLVLYLQLPHQHRDLHDRTDSHSLKFVIFRFQGGEVRVESVAGFLRVEMHGPYCDIHPASD